MGAGTAAWLNSFDVQSCQDNSFFGLAIGGGPLGVIFFVALPCGRAPELVANRGLAASPGAQPASKAVTTISEVVNAARLLMPTTVAIG